MKALTRSKTIGGVLLLCLLVASLNVIAKRLATARWDTTDGNVYTLTEGTRSIIKKAKDSDRRVTIRFYMSNPEDVQLPKKYVDYSKRVKDLLEEYAKLSNDSIVVQTFVPVPNSQEQDAAELDGIQLRDPRMDMAQSSNLDDYDYNQLASQPYYFGLSISSLEKIERIPFLDPELERKLEYQLSRSISAVTRKSMRKIGLLEGNEMSLGGSPGMMGAPGRPPSVIYRHLAREFEIVNVPFDVGPMKPGDTDHPFSDLDLLLIVHPVKINRPQSPQPGMPPMGNTTLELISKETQYAIDQYLVNGGKAVAFLDNQHFVSRFFDIYSAPLPFAQQDRNPQWYKDLYDLFERSGWEHYRSGLDDLTTAWGVDLGGSDQPMLYDPKYSRAVMFDRPLNQMLQREFQLNRLLGQIPDRRYQNQIIQPLLRGNGLMAKFENEALTSDHPVTRDLSTIQMVDPSPIVGKPTSGLKMRTLVSTSGRAKSVPGNLAHMLLSQGETQEQIQSSFQSAGIKQERYPVAVVLEGKFKSAYEEDPTQPDPAEEPPAPVAPAPFTPPVQAPLLPEGAPDSTNTPEPAPEPAPEPGEGCEEANEEESTTEAESEAEAPKPPAEDAPSADTPASAPAEEEGTDEKEPDPTEDPAEPSGTPSPETSEEDAPTPGEEDHHISEGTEEGTIAIISDVDILFDYFMGDPERGASRDNNNVDFILNLVENLAGDQDLLKIRGRDSTSRPFVVINDIREKAAGKVAGERQEIQKKIEEANRKLAAGQQAQDVGGGLMIIGQSEESLKEVRKIETEIRDLQRKENKVNRDQREDIQAAINSYEWTNMLLTPTLVILIGLVVGITRKVKTAAK